ncbi:hypothetical protein GOBAR_DD36987 [Gossypium barbadense]|nr:hypothetical protein GOBAR_DD36987 [Gossypium barbadense]
MIKNQILLLFAFYSSLLGELSGKGGGLGPAVDSEEVDVGLIVDMGSREGKVIHGRVSMAISDFNSFGRDNQMRIKYDAAVGDITITSNRSLYVDFTLPFTDMGIGMVSRLTPKENQNLWIFLKPLTPGLWLTIVGVYVLSALFIWLIERPAPVEQQTGQSNGEIGRMFGFSFSIFVFAHWEKLSSNLSRSVVVLWVFVLFILGSNYTATLTSMMTVQQIEFNTGKSIVGRGAGPVAQGAIGNPNFPNSHSKSIRLTSLEEYVKALSEGSKNGGVSAIIEEMPYINVMVEKYPTRYSKVGHVMPTTNGFGFAFRKGSPIAHDISREIAKLREDGTLQRLENEWFKNPIIDFDSRNTSDSVNPLTKKQQHKQEAWRHHQANITTKKVQLVKMLTEGKPSLKWARMISKSKGTATKMKCKMMVHLFHCDL